METQIVLYEVQRQVAPEDSPTSNPREGRVLGLTGANAHLPQVNTVAFYLLKDTQNVPWFKNARPACDATAPLTHDSPLRKKQQPTTAQFMTTGLASGLVVKAVPQPGKR